MEDAVLALIIISTVLIGIPTVFIGMPWLVMHYLTRWKTAPTLTDDDEQLLDELYQLARKLESRVETVERLVAADNAEFHPAPRVPDAASTPASPSPNTYRTGTRQ